jgi:glycosyltransferase involved in cell wall biosynthesis
VIDALAARFGGTAYAVIQLSRVLAREPRMAEVIVVTRAGSIVDGGVRPDSRVRIIRLGARGRGELIERLGWEALRLPAIVRAESADVVLTFSGMLPRDPGCPTISYLANPVPFENRRGVKAAIRRRAIERTAHQAAAVYVPSSHFAHLVANLPRVRVVPLGVDHDVFRPREHPGGEILCVSDFYRHKRHDLLLDAYDRLPADRPVLRLVGNPSVDPEWFSLLQARASEKPGVILAGMVSFELLLDAYARARVFVMPSEHESFSMPLAESLCCGVPAIARDHPALRETGGSGAWYIAGDDPSAWAEAIDAMLTDDDRHQQFRVAGLQEAKRFSWESMATRLLDDLAELR